MKQNMQEIENLVGKLFHYFHEERAVEVGELFCEDAELELPDCKERWKGRQEITRFWEKKIKKRKQVPFGIKTIYFPCDLYFEEKGEEYCGEWNTYSFRSEKDYDIQYFLTHMQVTVQWEITGFKFKTMKWNEILELVPWKFDGSFSQGVNNMLNTQEMEESILSQQDYIAIRNLQGHFSHEGMDRKAEWFSQSKEAGFSIPCLFEHRISGYEQIKKAFQELREKEKKNNNYYVFLPLITAPVIYGNETQAKGSFLTLSFEVHADAYGVTESPYPLYIRGGRFTQQYQKEDGKWKFTEFCHETFFTIQSLSYRPDVCMRHRMREKELWENTWLTGPEETGVAAPEDVFSIEFIMPQWTGRIRSGNSMDFVDAFMVNDKEEISTLIAGSTMMRTIGYDNIMQRFGPRQREGRRENPAFHTLCTPVIEFSEDGCYAKAAWIDFAMADFSGAFDFPLNPVCYHLTVNKYYHEFVKENGKWKLFNFGWEPGLFLGAVPFDESSCRGFYKGWSKMSKDFPVLGEAYFYD